MNSQELKIFLQVASCRNFSSAAEQLYLSQSVVSYHISKLEKELGFALFDRNTHRVELTQAGTIFYKAILRLSAQYETALEQAKKAALGTPDRLRICFGTPTSPTMMGQIMNRICTLLSLKELDLSKRSYDDDVLQPLLTGQTDILFTYPPFCRRSSGLEKKAFCLTWICCMMHPEHPLANRTELTISDLSGQTLILVNSKNARTEYRDVYRRIRQSGKHGPRLESTPKTFDQAQGFAMAKRGIMLVRTLDPRRHPNIDGLTSIPLSDADPMPLIAVWRKNALCPLGQELLGRIPAISGAAAAK